MINKIQDISFLNIEIFHSTISDWIFGFFIFFVSLITLKLIKKVLITRLKKISQKTKTKLDNIAVKSLDNIHSTFFTLLSLYITETFVHLTNNFIEKIIHYALLIFATYYAIKILQELLEFSTDIIIQKNVNGDENNIAIVKIISKIAKISLWVAAALLILSNLGYNISSLVAGLGIGGIAIALALQNILSDVFSSFSIFFDKPFRVGDYIVVDKYKGVVKKIGMKTTRLQSSEGEELIISNNELTKSKLQNYGVMDKRRVSFNINVDQETSPKKLKQVNTILEKIIKSEKETEIDRIHFAKISENHFIYDIAYFVSSKEYRDYMDIQQNINLAIVEQFAKEDIKFSHPTQTVYVKNDR